MALPNDVKLTKYTVKENDTEYGLAKSNKISVGSLKQVNKDLPQPYFVAGNTIKIPNKSFY